MIRGEEHLPLNPTLDYAVRHGMTIDYLDRTTYRAKTSPEVIEGLRRQFGDFFLIPEGGSNAAAVRGAAEIAAELTVGVRRDLLPLRNRRHAGRPRRRPAAGQARDRLLRTQGRRIPQRRRPAPSGRVRARDDELDDRARLPLRRLRSTERGLDDFIDEFRERHGIELEWVYVAKMLYGVLDMVGRGTFATGESVVAVVTGPPYSLAS